MFTLFIFSFGNETPDEVVETEAFIVGLRYK